MRFLGVVVLANLVSSLLDFEKPDHGISRSGSKRLATPPREDLESIPRARSGDPLSSGYPVLPETAMGLWGNVRKNSAFSLCRSYLGFSQFKFDHLSLS